MCKILSRINDIAEREGISIAVIEKRIGASRGVISKAIKNGTDIQSKWLTSICDNFPNYSTEWLLTGNGEMLKTPRQSENTSHIPQRVISPILKEKDKKVPTSQKPEHDDANETRPRIPFDAAAGSLSHVGADSVLESECERIPVIPTFPRYDFTIFARGDSMEPQYLSGDELACRIINESSFIQWGRAHVLDTAQGIVVKRIYDHGSSITCKSNNPDYPDFDIPKEDIHRIALVVGYLRIE